MRKPHRIPRTARRFVTKDISFAAMFITVCPPVLSHGKNDDNLPAKKACIRQGCEKSGKRKISYTTKAYENFPQKKDGCKEIFRSSQPSADYSAVYLYMPVYNCLYRYEIANVPGEKVHSPLLFHFAVQSSKNIAPSPLTYFCAERVILLLLSAFPAIFMKQPSLI